MSPSSPASQKGKARVRDGLGTKVGLATILGGGFVVGARSIPGNPHSGHTMAPVLEQVGSLTDTRPRIAVVDRGYRSHGVRISRVPIRGQRGIAAALTKLSKRQSAIEPETGHMKSDG